MRKMGQQPRFISSSEIYDLLVPRNHRLRAALQRYQRNSAASIAASGLSTAKVESHTERFAGVPEHVERAAFIVAVFEL